jgi:hypothetical protein
MMLIIRQRRAEVRSGSFIPNESPAMTDCLTCQPNRDAATQRVLMIVARMPVRQFYE